METTVLALVGSAVDEFHAELSRVYAQGFLDVMSGDPGYRVHIAYVSPDGMWKFPDGIDAANLDAAESMSVAEALCWIVRAEVDAVIPQMFCRPGMTTYRAAFDLLQVPYLGNTPEVMAMAADKNIARAVVSAAGVAVPRGAVIGRDMIRPVEVTEIEFPVVVKPVDSDNSMGVSVVRTADTLDDAITEALRYSATALVEQYVPLGREVRCGIISRNGELVCLPLEEYAVDEQTRPIRSRSDKLDRSGAGELYLVAKDPAKAWIVDVDDPITDAVWAAARRCYSALRCRHYGLFDFRIDPDGTPWFLEAGLYCSYSPSSVVAVMAASAGIDARELVAASMHELSREGGGR